ncbi:unnamed protein product [Trypanosoma congolense IL3000]|uniref:WGS project CAEQ00000000 data, annotated contig 395 n=1 Tax=Trypanosoma congolense (strain IL3000) TaxID=1068625 RepID=F9WFJ6_TRYCI|nr:unnamed protein product [Trypanosoma congolense IL3000]
MVGVITHLQILWNTLRAEKGTLSLKPSPTRFTRLKKRIKSSRTGTIPYLPPLFSNPLDLPFFCLYGRRKRKKKAQYLEITIMMIHPSPSLAPPWRKRAMEGKDLFSSMSDGKDESSIGSDTIFGGSLHQYADFFSLSIKFGVLWLGRFSGICISISGTPPPKW